MLDTELLDILVCPESKQTLRLVDTDEVKKMFAALPSGARTRAGEEVAPMDGALVREDGQLLYPIRDGIPIMLIDEAVPLS